MMNVLAAQLLSLPTGAKSDVAPKMPWPNGSLLTAILTATDSEGSVILSLGGYRLRAQVPPNTPLGHVWLLLLNREMPAQFRLLHEARAASMLVDMLTQKLVKQPHTDVSKPLNQASPQAWYKMDGEGLPFVMEQGASGQYVMLHDRKQGAASGMVHRQREADGFLLHGRVDLDRLGAVMFALHSIGNSWELSVYAERGESVERLRGDFSTWMQKQATSAKCGVRKCDIEGRVIHGLPEQISFMDDLKV